MGNDRVGARELILKLPNENGFASNLGVRWHKV